METKKLVMSGVMAVGVMPMILTAGRASVRNSTEAPVAMVEPIDTSRTEVVLLPTGLCGLVFDCAEGAPRATVDPGKLVLLPTGLCGLVFDCQLGYPGAGN